MKKLSKSDLATLESLKSRLATSGQDLERAIEDYNTAIETASDTLATVVIDYNLLVAEAQDFRDQIVESIDEYVGDKSDKWQQSDRASVYQAWLDEWRHLELTVFEANIPDSQTGPTENLAEVLNELSIDVEV